MSVDPKLKKIREEMKAKNYDAYIVMPGDQHNVNI